MALDAATSDNTAIRIVPEAVVGVMPVAPELQSLRYTSENLIFHQRSVIEGGIRAERDLQDLIRVDGGVLGTIRYAMAFGSFDQLLEGALASTFSAPVSGASVLKNGRALTSFTVQKHFKDSLVPVYQNFLGCVVNAFELMFVPGKVIEGSFGLVGITLESGMSQIAGATVVAPNGDSPVMNAITDLIELQKDGVAVSAKVQSLGLNLNNNVYGMGAIGAFGHLCFSLGRLDVSGPIELLFENDVEHAQFLQNDAFSLSFKLEDPSGDFYRFTLPKVRYEASAAVADQVKRDIVVNGRWRAVYDPVSNCTIQVDRFDAP